MGVSVHINREDDKSKQYSLFINKDRLDLPATIDSILIELKRDGYPLARLDSIVSTAGQTDMYFSPDRRLVLSNNPAQIVTESYLIDQSYSLLDSLSDSGYPFAKVIIVPDSIKLSQTNVTALIDFKVDAGNFYRIGRVEFSGNNSTSQKLLQLESGMKRGDVYSRSTIESARKRLERLSYIASVNSPKLKKISDGIMKIGFQITEQKVNLVSGILAAEPNSQKLTGELNLQFGNLFGTGREVGFSWLGLNPQRSGIMFNYLEPWIMDRPIQLEYEMERWNDTTSVLTRNSLSLAWEAFDRVIIDGKVSNEQISIKTGSGVEANSIRYGLGAAIDRLDHVWNPAAGFAATYSTQTGTRKWVGRDVETASVRQEELMLELAQSLNDLWVIYERFSVDDVAGSGVIREDLIRFGGVGSIRGYDEDKFLARGVLSGSVELRWRPDKNGFAGIFGDFGYTYRYGSALSYFDRNLSAVGISASLQTKAGQIELDIGVPAGESFNQARLHVKLASRF